MQHYNEPSRATGDEDDIIKKGSTRRGGLGVAARLACAAGVAMLGAAGAFAQQPQQAQPVPPPHGLAGNGATAGSPTSDTVITAKAKAALLAAKGVHGTHIKVTTEQGVVTLSGSVPNAEEKARATSAVQGVSGVARVNNTLDVDEARQ